MKLFLFTFPLTLLLLFNIGVGYNNPSLPQIFPPTFTNVTSGGGGAGSNVTSVSGSQPIIATPTTGNVIVSFNNTYDLDFRNMPIGYSQDWFNSTNIPLGMYLMNGTNLSRTGNPGCFAYLGLQFGNTTSTDFKIPDLRGRGIMYLNDTNVFTAVGQTGGEYNHTANVDNLETHSHTISYDLSLQRQGTGAFVGAITNLGSGFNSASTDNTGNMQGFNLLDPYITAKGQIIRC